MLWTDSAVPFFDVECCVSEPVSPEGGYDLLCLINIPDQVVGVALVHNMSNLLSTGLCVVPDEVYNCCAICILYEFLLNLTKAS